MHIVVRYLSATEAHTLCAVLRAARLQIETGDTQLAQTDELLMPALDGACGSVPARYLDEAL